MSLPNSTLAYVPRAKLVAYLLSPEHPVGTAKTEFFQALGFTVSSPELLEAQLLAIAQLGELHATAVSPHGVKYELRGMLIGPSGRTTLVTTIWIVEIGDIRPRLVTAYPV